ncbi:hypothetical protein GPECTOR_8g202 [Gonium pectorale]|uniref:Uncharacterized protein n=1 Tax=Gonium pectorale TaxID=33097 RepID=A0A150GT00_GONPE|nr:hypothetical protein GPECTOR_8g202 [Gonium pectorale]|eukprot:KXZ52818.1 hypothetical protein GPECTOR_8g202 [Gonium pectorale]
MAHDSYEARVGAASKTIAALNYHTERVRERAGELVSVVRHEEILGAAVENHHKSKSLLGSNLPRHYHVSEVRAQNTRVYQEVDEFDSDLDIDDENIEGSPSAVNGASMDSSDVLGIGGPSLAGRGQTSDQHSSLMLENSSVAGSSDTNAARKGLAAAGGSASQKKLIAADLEMDSLNMLRRMRSQTAMRCGSVSASHPTLEAVKRGGHMSPALNDEDLDDTNLTLHELKLVRGKSFLARPDLQSGAAEDMLAQIRGAKWQSDSITISRVPSNPPPGGLFSKLKHIMTQ